MKLTGRTIFITGGGSGIGRGLAEALFAKGNQVIISGRRKAKLDEVTAANPGMQSVELDVESAESIAAVAKQIKQQFPKLDVVINNAGIAKVDGVGGEVDDALAESIVTTNILGPIRVTSALIEQLKAQPDAAVIYVSSGLAFVPFARSATYSATKAFVHSFALSQRYELRKTNVKVLEIAPPYVQTELGGEHQLTDPRAMPLKDFIAATMEELATDKNEVLTKEVMMLRNGAGLQDYDVTVKFNDMMAG